jgi:hypothetical protein
VIEGANRHDMKLVTDSLCRVPQNIEDKRLEHLAAGEQEQGLCLDASYDYDEVREIAYEFGYTTHIRSRGEEKKAKEAGKKARRWVPLGSGTHAYLAQPLSSLAGALGGEATQLLGVTAFCLCSYYLEEVPFRIGSK